MSNLVSVLFLTIGVCAAAVKLLCAMPHERDTSKDHYIKW